MALWEVNQNRQGFVQFNLYFFLSTRKSKMENATDIKSKSFFLLKRLNQEIK